MVQTSIYRCSDIIKQSIEGKFESRPHICFLTGFLCRHFYSMLILHLVLTVELDYKNQRMKTVLRMS